ncbi:hypothetical protein [Streptomyces sp. CAU 1734]|uniref:hypothetical protein n=1 Tax=Streptomyces sp. CAU 1734 TaxID=3140360 RepID=UPI0032614765
MTLTLVGLHTSTEITADYLPIDRRTTTTRVVLRRVVPVAAGDHLDIDAWARVTNETNPGYVVGVGWGLRARRYEAGPDAPWVRISPSCGDNVDRQRHHMPLAISSVHAIPQDWPAGHRLTVALVADAHSSASRPDDELIVDAGYGHLTVRQLRPA